MKCWRKLYSYGQNCHIQNLNTSVLNLVTAAPAYSTSCPASPSLALGSSVTAPDTLFLLFPLTAATWCSGLHRRWRGGLQLRRLVGIVAAYAGPTALSMCPPVKLRDLVCFFPFAQRRMIAEASVRNRVVIPGVKFQRRQNFIEYWRGILVAYA